MSALNAAIDIGSNSILLLIVDGERVVHDEARVIGLGKGMGDRGVFRPDRMEAALATLRDYAAKAQELGVPAAEVRAVATSASRRALNATTFYANVLKATGLRVQVISGDEEARLTWKGGISGMDVATFNRRLVEAGVGVTTLLPRTRSLEDLFLEVTSTEDELRRRA